MKKGNEEKMGCVPILLHVFGEEGLNLDNRICRSCLIVFDPVVHIYCFHSLHIKAMVSAWIDLQDHFVAGLFLGHPLPTCCDRGEVVQLADQDQKRKLEIGKGSEAVRVKSNDGAKGIFLLTRREPYTKGSEGRGPSAGPSDGPNPFRIHTC